MITWQQEDAQVRAKREGKGRAQHADVREAAPA
jgi:hypothetical protein